ncbi:MAG: flagellar hook-length control protein FliK [Azoarcus sp.]|jgi:hypothetical protein|nr:flagellar hook-length control protein FliK [Azoarcus sp.]
MIPSDLAARLRFLHEASLFETSPPVAGLQRAREIQTQLQDLVPGQRFFATLQRTLPDGTFRALVAGQQVTLALNASAQPGDTLELVATRVSPGLVVSKLATEAAAMAGSARPTLSPTGQLISFLLTGQPASTPTTLANNQPLLNAPPAGQSVANPAASGAGAQLAATANPATGATLAAGAASPGGAVGVGASAHLIATTQLAPLLRQALSQSGLFYEAHQAQWLAGKVDLAALLREPQAQAASPTPGQSPATSTPASQSGSPTAALAGQNAATSGAAPTANVGAAARAEAAASGNAALQAVARNEEPVTAVKSAIGQYAENAMRNGPIAERLLPIVHQQLEALASQQYVFHGMAWPGQPFELIVEDPRGDWHGGAGGEETDTEWNTTLRLTLPRLGGVEARVSLNAAGVALRLQTADADAAAALEARRDELAEALAAADVPLTGMAVETVEQRDGR